MEKLALSSSGARTLLDCWRNSENLSGPTQLDLEPNQPPCRAGSEGNCFSFQDVDCQSDFEVPVNVEDHVKLTDLSTSWRRGTHWLVGRRRGACVSLGQSPTNLSDGESITSEQRRVPDLTRNQPLCAKRFWKGDVSNDRYAVAVDAFQESTTLDVTGERRMNVKLTRTGVRVCSRTAASTGMNT